MRLIKHILFYFLALVLVPSQAQILNGRFSEEEVNTQKVFIDASREKILGNYENAAELYREVLKRDKSNHAAAYELARVYDVLDENEKALKSIKSAVAFDKDNMWYQLFMADIYEKLQKYEEAAKVYEKLSLSITDKDYYIYTRWAYYLVKANDIPKAIQVYDQLEQKIGIDEEIVNKKHALHLGLGNQEAAAAELEKLVAAFPSDLNYYHQLANFYSKTGNKEKAKGIYTKILEINPEDAQAQIASADAIKKGGDDVAYLNSLKSIFQKPDVNIDVKIKELIPYIHKIADSKDARLADAGLALGKTLTETHPREAKAFSVYADLLYYADRKEEALEKYLKTIELNPNVFTVWEQAMYIYTETGDMKGLLKITEDALDYFPNQAKAYYFNGIAYHGKKEYRSAVDAYMQSLMMAGKNPRLKFDVFSKMADSYFQLKDYKRSDKAFDDALKLNPGSHQLLNTYSQALAKRGENLDKAKAMASTINELKPNHPSYQDTYGWILYKMKEFQGAKEWISKALANGGEDDPLILEHFGDVLYQLSDTEKALEYWQKAAESGSTSELLSKKIADKKLYE